MRVQASDSVSIFYETYGDSSGEPVVLIHGLGADHLMWQPQIETYPAQGLHLIVPDLRGHGESSRIDRFRLAESAGDIAVLLDQLGLSSVVVVGVSLGGLVAQQFASDYPDRVNQLVVCDSFCNTKTLSRQFAGWLQWVMLKVWPKALLKTLPMAYKGEEKKAALEYLSGAIAKMDAKQVIVTRAAINKLDLREQLAKITAPTMVAVGTDFGDIAIKMAREVADHIPGSRFEIIEGGCDPSNLTAAERFDDLLLGFIER